MAMTARVLELRQQGREIIGFAAGEPDFDTWPHVCEAAHEAIRRGDFRYTAVGGTPELKNAIVTKLLRDNNLTYGVREVIATCGGKHALYNAMQAILNEGDEVLIPAPFWVSYADMAILAGGVPKPVPAREERGFKLSAAELEAAIGPRTRLIILNSPSNPTGAAYDEAELRELAAVLRRYEGWILSDDVYEMIYYEGQRPPHLLAIEPSLRERTVVVNSVSKTYAMTGWRIGYAAGPAELIAAMTTIQGQQTSNPTAIAQAAAAAALCGPQDRIAPMVEEFRRRRDYVCERIEAIEGLSAVRPAGAFYVFVNARGIFERTGARDGADLAMKILEGAGVGLVGGNDFGSPDHVRISYATSMEQLERGFDAIERWLASL
ncbi:MAG: pyridoxal phosphate-dependent aminotransferase [Candidatus Dadabacteria bacterium]|nr:MAG: pyridoxal phosphate-dependent aminotransferase [Candidatus Dadabacteria bacterium]